MLHSYLTLDKAVGKRYPYEKLKDYLKNHMKLFHILFNSQQKYVLTGIFDFVCIQK